MTNLEKLLSEATERPWKRADSRSGKMYIVGADNDGVSTTSSRVCRIAITEPGPTNVRLIALAVNRLEEYVTLLGRVAHQRTDPLDPILHNEVVDGCLGCEARAFLAQIEKEAASA